MPQDGKKKALLTGNQAIARGFYEAGGLVAASYPGSPTVDIMESLHQYPEVYSEFSVNEKVALEVAMGGSFAGARAMAVMKHVGVNIAADPLMTFTQSRTNGGFLLVTGDDPGMASSQNEQDNRLFGKFANLAILDPSDSQEAKDFTQRGLRLSEEFQTPVMLRITSRLCHSRSVVELAERSEAVVKGFEADPSRYCMLPPHTIQAQHFMQERLQQLAEFAYDTDLNQLVEVEGSDTLIITAGLVYQHVQELEPPVSVYKLGLIYPLPMRRMKELSERYARIIVVEEMMPFIENELKIHGIGCQGKEYFSFTGELQIEDVERGLVQAGVLSGKTVKVAVETSQSPAAEQLSEPIVERGPMFCAGCPHRPVFDILKKKRVTVIGDIGCYSMGLLYPFEVLKVNISMGSSLGIIKGMGKVWDRTGNDQPLVGVIGDGTLFHSGLPGFVNLLHELDPAARVTMIILDNGTTAMTGGQPNASSGKYEKYGDMQVDIDNLLRTMGFQNVQRIDQFDYQRAKEVITTEIDRPGLSIVITSRPCALQFKIKEPYFEVHPDICIGCRTCVRTNCPPIQMREYPGFDKLKSSIDPERCVGCSICAQVCPVNAIRRGGDAE